MARVGVGNHRGWHFPECSFSLNCQVIFSNVINIDVQSRFGGIIDVQAMKGYDAGAIRN